MVLFSRCLDVRRSRMYACRRRASLGHRPAQRSMYAIPCAHRNESLPGLLYTRSVSRIADYVPINGEREFGRDDACQRLKSCRGVARGHRTRPRGFGIGGNRESPWEMATAAENCSGTVYDRGIARRRGGGRRAALWARGFAGYIARYLPGVGAGYRGPSSSVGRGMAGVSAPSKPSLSSLRQRKRSSTTMSRTWRSSL
jgi:hypothetical protein